MKLNRSQADRLSEILGNLSLVFVASLILPGILDLTYRVTVVIAGLILSFSSFYFSLHLLKGIRR